VKPAPFEMHSPEQVSEALDLLAEHGDDAKVLAGGQSLVPMLALRLTRFGHLVDLNRVGELTGLDLNGTELRVGAMTRHSAVERSEEVAAAVPLLSRATAKVGHFQIRNRGTVGGSIAHADPAAEQPAVCLALDAVMEVSSTTGTREIPAASFFEGTWATTMELDELLTGVRFPVWSGRTGFAVEELSRRSGDFALVGVTCGVGLGDAGEVQRAAVALFGVGPTPVRAPAAEEALVSGSGTAEAGAAAAADLEPGDDLHASGAYRKRVAAVLVERALDRALEEAKGA
jgi:aerobic carbon-monoxide dehydrogenase medium subunit